MLKVHLYTKVRTTREIVGKSILRRLSNYLPDDQRSQAGQV
jgi:hypothetical protein